MYSMTGYGRASAAAEGRTITVELKSVNHRFLDLSVRTPRSLAFLEDLFREELTRAFSRGHIDVFTNYVNERADARTVHVNAALIASYVAAAREANEVAELRDDLTLSACLRLPEVVEVLPAEEDAEAISALAKEALGKAMQELRAMRLAEGERLKSDLAARADTVADLTEKIAARAPGVVTEYRDRLDARIAQLIGDGEVDKARLATEVALFADRASIDEEITRLRSHVKGMRDLLEATEPAGRRLDFVVQEMNREFNTIGSKANDGELTGWVLTGKAEIEKLREQIQNIE